MDGAEELEIIAILESWPDQTQGFLRRDALMNADPALLKDQDILDRMGLEFLMKMKQREVARQVHAVRSIRLPRE